MESSQTSSLVDGSHVVGRENDKREIIKLLLSDDCNNCNVTMVSIVADSGIGKTTMVHLVYNDERVSDALDIRLFVCLPEKFDEKRLLKGIIESVTGASCDITDLSILEKVLKDEFTRKKFLLVLDNAENKSQSFWNNLLKLLNIAAKGSVVLVTMTGESPFYVTGEMFFYHLNRLSNSNCWKIFQQNVFYGLDPKAFPDLVNIGKNLLAKCRNNTLCVRVLSGLLRLSVNEQSWRAILGSNLWEVDGLGGDILPVLGVCYDFLPIYLKHCFRYCSLFPKDYIFSKNFLVRIWMSQGYIEPSEGTELEDIDSQYFDELLYRSFFQYSPVHDTKEDKFVMHGLIHDLARCVSKNECFRSEDFVQRMPENACHLSIAPYEFKPVSLKNLTEEARDLQTVLVVCRSMLQQECIFSPIVNLVDLNDVFVKFSNLRSLDVSHTDIEELPNSIGLLKNLHYLDFSNTNVKSIPLEISNLINLQSLEAKNCNYLMELPESIQALINLRHLSVTKDLGYIGMPRGIGKLTNLCTLLTFNVGSDELHSGIEELKNLECLRGCLQISGLENISSQTDAREANLKGKVFMESLSLQWGHNTMCLEDNEGIELAEKVIESLEPSRNLQELIIRNFTGNQFPLWMEDPSFLKLVSVILNNCYNCSKFPALGRLPSLKHLSIQKMYNVQRLEFFDCTEKGSRFPSLEILNLWEIYELEEWIEIGHGDFPCLRSLCINKCPLLRYIPCFPSLVELSLHCFTQLPIIGNFASLECLKIEGFQKVKSLKLPNNLLALRKLEISRCIELLSVEGLSQLSTIEKIKLTGCPKLDLHSSWQPNYIKAKSGIIDMSTRGKGPEQQKMLMKRKDHEDVTSLISSLTQWEEQIKQLDLQQTAAKLLAARVQQTFRESIAQARLVDCASVSMEVAERSTKAPNLQSVLCQDSEDFSYRALASGIACASGSEQHIMSKKRKRLSQSKSMRRVTTATLDDGFSWRKYGEKEIPGNRYPRFYFCCEHRLNRGCPATRQVERSDKDPSLFIITYCWDHICLDNLHSAASAATTAIIKHLSQSKSMRRVTTATLDDGFSWRKYGQKEIPGNRYPRSYFRCEHRVNRGCPATRQVELSNEDPSLFIITYRGDHICLDNLHSAASAATAATMSATSSAAVSTVASVAMTPSRDSTVPLVAMSSSCESTNEQELVDLLNDDFMVISDLSDEDGLDPALSPSAVPYNFI